MRRECKGSGCGKPTANGIDALRLIEIKEYPQSMPDTDCEIT